ncbi:ATP-binding protein [Amycolatopsis thermophila]|uniref:Anti-sigma regulatory factor (Ser/Thr protein kinase) n=1 Tax=Amycolatopsis thermophila TaxID=206084 RepID=A0ABU0EVV8_9PSEU|nr:ATP-binding protein [Amycolatopsis thermophila]MDQ0379458.1 anti-sigma regulatory factor (Ser/Thr protein kinase) [Amycolatopsis thermophila]
MSGKNRWLQDREDTVRTDGSGRPTKQRSTSSAWRRAVTRLPEEAPAAGQAREFTSSALRAWQVPDDTREDVVLAASELVTNAVEHGHGEVTVVLRQCEDRLTLRVWDDDVQVPVPRARDRDPMRGNGLVIVEAVSDAWGYETGSDGKWVWAEFAVG